MQSSCQQVFVKDLFSIIVYILTDRKVCHVYFYGYGVLYDMFILKKMDW